VVTACSAGLSATPRIRGKLARLSLHTSQARYLEKAPRLAFTLLASWFCKSSPSVVMGTEHTMTIGLWLREHDILCR